MTHILTIETQSESQFAQIKGFAERLGVYVKETHTETSLSEAEELALLERIHWEGDETGDELNAMLQSSRHFGSREVDL